MNILLSYLELDTLRAMEQDLDLGLFYEIDRRPRRAPVRRPNAIRRRRALVTAELDRRKGD